MDSLKDFNPAMIHIIRKMLVLLKNSLNYLKDNILNDFLKSIIDIFLKYFFSKYMIIESLSHKHN